MGTGEHQGGSVQVELFFDGGSNPVGQVPGKTDQITGYQHRPATVGRFQGQHFDPKIVQGAFGRFGPGGIPGKPHRPLRRDLHLG
jgi:hypothetical protein